MEQALRGSAAHVFVAADAFDAPGHLRLEAADAHHLSRVLRLRPGEPVTVSDGAGRWRPCQWRTDATLVTTGDIRVEERPLPSITVGFAPVKGDRPEWTVQKLTELGVDRIVPLRTERSVVRWEGERALIQVERLRRVAREASMQARRCHVPIVEEVMAPADVSGAALAHFGGVPISLCHTTVLVGPEGGWTQAETHASPTVSLGPLVLRAETAALAAAALLASQRTRRGSDPEHGPWS